MQTLQIEFDDGGERETIEQVLNRYEECTSGCGRNSTRIMEVFSHDGENRCSHLEGRCGYHTHFTYNDAIVRARLVNNNWVLEN